MNLRFWHRSLGKRTSIPRLLRRLLPDERGSYLLYATIAMPVFLGFAGLASEGSLLFYNHRALQSATDAAAYSAAVAYSNGDTGSTALTTQAEAIVANYGFVVGTGNNQVNVATPTVIPKYAGTTNTAIQVNTTRSQLPTLSSLWIGNPFNVSVSATALVSASGGVGGGTCLLALGKTATGNNAADAIQLQGNPSINVPGCGVYSNSNDCLKGSVSVALGGNASINASSVGSAGCISLGGNSSINIPGGGAYTQQDGTLSDPYAGTPLPSTPATPCVNQPAGKAITLSPGRYCGLNGDHVDITLTGGIYILDSNGSSNTTLVVKNGTLTDNGAGSTLVFTCSTCTKGSQWPSTMMAVDANGTVNLTAPTSGSTAGFVMMGDSNMPFGTVFDSHSNPAVTLSGTVYVPNGAFTWGGNPTSAGGSSCLQIIVNTITMSGDSAFGGAGCRLSSGGGAGGAGKPIGSVVTLVD